MILGFLLGANIGLAAAQSLGCFQISSAPSNVATMWSAMPSQCASKCGSNRLAVLAPYPNDEWTFQCGCMDSFNTLTSVSPSLCSLRCLGAPIPSQAPYCGGFSAGNPSVVVWSVYGSLPAPSPTVQSQSPPTSPPQQPVFDVNPVVAIALPQVADSSPIQSQSVPHATGSVLAAAIPAPPPISPKSGTEPIPVSSAQGNNSFLISGVVGAVVVLTVGFAAIAQRRRKQNPLKQEVVDSESINHFEKSPFENVEEEPRVIQINNMLPPRMDPFPSTSKTTPSTAATTAFGNSFSFPKFQSFLTKAASQENSSNFESMTVTPKPAVLGAMSLSLEHTLLMPALNQLVEPPKAAMFAINPLWSRFSAAPSNNRNSSSSSFRFSSPMSPSMTPGHAARDSTVSRTASSLFMQGFEKNVAVETDFRNETS
ncbi:UNVERIFIED_CONTAM: hypothetical protein HDU68_009589 [Siphonaria sp. JEL0065]|nr:hypothetical protein HDU68_009589 [Siphonaria sp. JEL0065]